MADDSSACARGPTTESALPADDDVAGAERELALLAELVARSADIDRADALYRRLSPFEALNVDTEEVSTGGVSRYLGLLATAGRRFDLAARHFQDGTALNRRMGARPWVARTQQDYAQMLLTRNHSGDKKRANDLARQPLATYRELRVNSYPFTAPASTERAAQPLTPRARPRGSRFDDRVEGPCPQRNEHTSMPL